MDWEVSGETQKTGRSAVSEDILGQLALRAGTPDDLALVYSDWLKSHRKNDAVKRFSNEIYFEGQRGIIDGLLKRASLKLLVSREDPSHIYGWTCFEPLKPIPVIHYVYVKHSYRGLGLSRTLLGEMLTQPVVYTHEAPFARRLASGSYFNPYKAMT